MKRGFGWAAWLDARKRVATPRTGRFDRTHGRADERAARAALWPRTGNVAASPIHPPTRKP
jgi:hypothetical protein